MKKYLLIIAIILSTMPVLASDWLYIGDGKYIDLESISKYPNSYLYPNNSMYTYWTKTVNDGSQVAKDYFNKLSQIDKTNIIEIRTQFITDCTKKNIEVVSIVAYAYNYQPVRSFHYNEFQYQWTNIVPDSYGEFYYKIVCKPKGY